MVRDTGQRIPCFDSFQLTITDIQHQRCTYGNGAILLSFKVLGSAAHGHTDDGQTRDNQNF